MIRKLTDSGRSDGVSRAQSQRTWMGNPRALYLTISCVVRRTLEGQWLERRWGGGWTIRGLTDSGRGNSSTHAWQGERRSVLRSAEASRMVNGRTGRRRRGVACGRACKKGLPENVFVRVAVTPAGPRVITPRRRRRREYGYIRPLTPRNGCSSSR